MVLGIYGSGGLGREILDIAKAINSKDYVWDEIVFIDDAPKSDSIVCNRVFNFETFSSVFKKDEAEVVIAVGEPFIRKMLRERMEESGYQLATIVHPNANIAFDCELSDGVVVSSNSMVSSRAKIGKNTYLQPTCLVGHDVEVGEDCVLSSFDAIAGGCHIGGQTYVGMSVPMKEGVKIGSGTIIGMGSVVQRDIPDEVIALGNPARAMKNNENHRVF